MRILNIEATHFVPYWKNQGHDILTLGPNPSCDIRTTKVLSLHDLWQELSTRHFHPDLIFWGDACRPPCVAGIEELPALTIGFSIDQYCNPWHVPYAAAFDIMLLAQKNYLNIFQRQDYDQLLEWFPLFCNLERDQDKGVVRDVPVGFVGTPDPPLNPKRKPFLTTFKKEHPLVLMQGDYVPLFNRCQIVLNQSAVGELNFRHFQAAACGAAVLTEDLDNGLYDLFTPGVDCLVYPRAHPEEAAHIAAQTIQQSGKIADIAEQGKSLVQKKHSHKVRAERILTLAQKYSAAGLPKKRRNHLQHIRKELSKAFFFLASDGEMSLDHGSREFYAYLGALYTRHAPSLYKPA